MLKYVLNLKRHNKAKCVPVQYCHPAKWSLYPGERGLITGCTFYISLHLDGPIAGGRDLLAAVYDMLVNICLTNVSFWHKTFLGIVCIFKPPSYM